MSTIKLIVSAVALAAAGSAAFAQSAIPPQWVDGHGAYTVNVAPSTSGLTRAQVRAETLVAIKAGEVGRFDADSYLPPTLRATPGNRFAGTSGTIASPAVAYSDAVSRDAVKADLAAARSSGALNPFDADPYVNVPANAQTARTPNSVAAR